MILFLRKLDSTSRNVLLILGFVALFTSISSSLVGSIASSDWWEGWLQNFSTEVMGAIMTFILFEQIVGKGQEEKSEKGRLMRQMRSQVNVEVIRAVEELRANGWLQNKELSHIDLNKANLEGVNFSSVNLEGANLRGANLKNANLQNAYLGAADLQNANLEAANLQGADLYNANLRGARFKNAKLAGVYLWDTNLTDVDLSGLDLQGSNMTFTNLQGTNLTGANLDNVNLRGAKLNQQTILPDGSYWTPDVNLKQFGVVFKLPSDN